MAKQRRTIHDPFRSIDGAALAWVVGGRITPRKGMDPAVVQGFQDLGKRVVELGQVMEAKRQEGKAQMGQLMQRVMQSRGA